MKKFRVWNKDWGMMAEPDTIQSIHFCGVTGEATDVDFIITTTDGTKNRQTWEDCGDDVLDFMQYTGLKDENGKEIYEGDIVKNIVGDLYTVGYSGSSYWLFIDGEEEDTFYSDSGLTYTIIGNIYENPELI